MNSTLLILLVVALSIYIIVRQFTEQVVNLRTLLLLPALSTYACYTDMNADFTHFTPTLLVVGLVVGVVPGLLTGIFRGRHTRVRQDSASGSIFSKPESASSFMWLGLLIVRIAVITLSRMPFGEHNVLIAMLTAFAASLFLVSIATQKFMVYQKSTHFQIGMPQQFLGQQRS
jgi:hypothetical protein